MADWVRVATFEADEAALDALVQRINSEDGPPAGVPAKSIIVSANRPESKVRVVTRYASEDDLRKGSEILDAMSPPGNMRRISVENFEIVLERQAS